MRNRKIAAAAGCLALLATSACSSTDSGNGADGKGGEVTVGAILSMSGVYATLGPAEKNAIELGVKKLNETGFSVGDAKHTLKFTYADDKSDPATTGVAALRQMVDADKLPVIAFGLGSSTYAPQLERTPVPMINILDSSYPSILDYSDEIFLMRGLSDTYVPGCLNYASKALGAKSIGIINTKGEPYGEGLTKLVQKHAPDQALTVSETADAPLGSPDYSAAIDKVVNGKPDVIYLSSVTGVILPVLKQLRQAGYDGPVMHSSGVNPDQAKAILGADFNVLMKDNFDCAGTLPTTSTDDAAKAFAADYQSAYGEYPQDLTMWAYDLPFVIAAAMSDAGTVSDSEKILDALGSVKVPDGTVSGWLASDSGAMFTDRDARTLSEVTTWCPGAQTIASAMVFDGLGGKVSGPQVHDDACASAK